MTGGIGTTFFMAPEVVTGDQGALQKHPFASDVYSYAILAWCILSSERPYATNTSCEGLNPRQITHRVVHQGLRPEVPALPHQHKDAGAGAASAGAGATGGDDEGSEKVEMNQSWPAGVCRLLERCWRTLADERPDFALVLKDMQSMRSDFDFDADGVGLGSRL
jgi:serine/threonine protein kinase